VITPRPPSSPPAGRYCLPDTKLQRNRLGLYPRLRSLCVWSLLVLQLAFGLWELAKSRDCQEKLRAEITETLKQIRARGDADFTANDFETMPYLVAVTKVRRNPLFASLKEGEIHSVSGQEILRNNPIAIDIVREPMEDDVLPLAKPIIGTSGRVYTELPIPRGTSVSVSTIGYNMCAYFIDFPPESSLLFSLQEPGFVGSRRSPIPTRAVVRNERAS